MFGGHSIEPNTGGVSAPVRPRVRSDPRATSLTIPTKTGRTCRWTPRSEARTRSRRVRASQRPWDGCRSGSGRRAPEATAVVVAFRRRARGKDCGRRCTGNEVAAAVTRHYGTQRNRDARRTRRCGRAARRNRSPVTNRRARRTTERCCCISCANTRRRTMETAELAVCERGRPCFVYDERSVW